MVRQGAHPSPTVDLFEPTFQVGGVSDGGLTTRQPLVCTSTAQVLFLAPAVDDAHLASIADALATGLAHEPADARAFRLVLQRATRDLRPRPRCLAAVWWDGGRAFAAATSGAAVSLIRGGRVVERISDAGELHLREGDRLALLCQGLDQCLRDGDELGRLVSAGPVGACGTTLVDVGRLRDGTDLAAVVAQIGPRVAAVPRPGSRVSFLDDLVGSLSETAGVRMLPEPEQAGEDPRVDEASPIQPTLELPMPTASRLSRPLVMPPAPVAPRPPAPQPGAPPQRVVQPLPAALAISAVVTAAVALLALVT